MAPARGTNSDVREAIARKRADEQALQKLEQSIAAQRAALKNRDDQLTALNDAAVSLTKDFRAAIAADEERADTERALAQTGADFLRQGGFNVGPGETSVSLHAADLFLGHQFRFYVRSTLPVEGFTKSDSKDAETSDGEAALEDGIKSALNDPFGGVLYTTVGWMPRLWPLGLVTAGSNDSVEKKLQIAEDNKYGAFVDLRTGFKAVTVPTDASDSDSERQVTPFYTVSVGPRIQLKGFADDSRTVKTGEIGLSILGVWNRVIDPGVSTLFTGDSAVLKRNTANITVLLAVLLGNNAYVSLEGTPKTSESELSKRWVIGVHLLGNGD